MGFISDIEEIIGAIGSEKRQTLLFSATMPAPIEKLSQRYMNHPQRVSITKENLTVPLIDQFYYETREKFEGLCRVLDIEETGKLIIFCRTKRAVDDLTSSLEARGYLAGGLHGDLSQVQRDRVMKKFREGRIDTLVATDVAARGIDIDDITHVINYDIPQDHESYVHRIGRTGRAGRKGVAMTFISPREYRQLRLIMKLAHTKIQRRELPTASDVLERQKELVKERLLKVLKQDDYDDYHTIISEVLEEGYDAVDIAAAALQLSLEGEKGAREEQQVSFENTGGAPGMVRFFFNIGRAQKVRPADIVRAIASEADIPGDTIGVINIYEKFSFVEVPEKAAERVLSAMHRNTVNGFKVNVEPARKR
jgi:ATP-dependent RNA helicase DeaD